MVESLQNTGNTITRVEYLSDVANIPLFSPSYEEITATVISRLEDHGITDRAEVRSELRRKKRTTDAIDIWFNQQCKIVVPEGTSLDQIEHVLSEFHDGRLPTYLGESYNFIPEAWRDHGENVSIAAIAPNLINQSLLRGRRIVVIAEDESIFETITANLALESETAQLAKRVNYVLYQPQPQTPEI